LVLSFGVSCGTDPLIHHGRHFGRTVHALCNVSALVTNGTLQIRNLADNPAEQLTNEYVIIPHIAFTHNKFMYINREQQEHQVFKLLLQMVPGIEGRLTESSDEDVAHIAELVGFFTLCLQTLIPTLE
jgi:hypothetical protein